MLIVDKIYFQIFYTIKIIVIICYTCLTTYGVNAFSLELLLFF